MERMPAECSMGARQLSALGWASHWVGLQGLAPLSPCSQKSPNTTKVTMNVGWYRRDYGRRNR